MIFIFWVENFDVEKILDSGKSAGKLSANLQSCLGVHFQPVEVCLRISFTAEIENSGVSHCRSINSGGDFEFFITSIGRAHYPEQ